MLPSPSLKKAKRYQSQRAVRSSNKKLKDGAFAIQWTKAKLGLACLGASFLAFFILSPIFIMELYPESASDGDGSTPTHVGLGSLIHNSKSLRQNWKTFMEKEEQYLKAELEKDLPMFFPHHHEQLPPKETLPPTQEDNLGRGVAGLPLAQTPALLGAKRGGFDCDTEVNVEQMAYWNQPQGLRDREFQTSFRASEEKFLTFEPDCGGWNNIRMSMELIFVLAAASGRTLVLPPDAPFYLLAVAKGQKHGARSFGNFFRLNDRDFARHVNIITMKDFIQQQGQSLLRLTPSQVQSLVPLAEVCDHEQNSPQNCKVLWEYLRVPGWQPPLAGFRDCVIFDERVFEGNMQVSDSLAEEAQRFCGPERHIQYYNSTWSEPPLLHWKAGEMDFRLLNHFYTFIHFTDPATDNFYKRFVRDFLHYNDQIYCAAGKVLKQLKVDAGDVGFSTMHIRRGDFQYKETRLEAEQWYNNTKEIWKPGELLYIATDERNKSWFDPIKKHHPIKFLDDYWDIAKLGDLDSSFLGMIDTIVSSHGRTFSGTWFSTFSGYINRMRGYLGYSMKDSWYSWIPRKSIVQPWEYPHGNYPAREWAIAWSGIDGDKWIEQELDFYPSPAGDHYTNSERLAELVAEADKVKVLINQVKEAPKVEDSKVNQTPKKEEVLINPVKIAPKVEADKVDQTPKKEEVLINQVKEAPKAEADKVNQTPKKEEVLINPVKEAPKVETELESKETKIEAVLKPMERHVPTLTLSDLVQDKGWTEKKMARGIAGRSLHDTPSLVGGSRAHIDCDVNVDSLAYWNDPQGERDMRFTSPFAVKGSTKYISFSPDRGGWNNVRMSMEIIFVIAAASGRTLVLPPEFNLYLLSRKKNKKGHAHHGFGDFFPLDKSEFRRMVPVITMEEFLKLEGGADGRLPIPEKNRTAVIAAAGLCEDRRKGEHSCFTVFDYLIEVGYKPTFNAFESCLIFDQRVYQGLPISNVSLSSTKDFCGARKVVFWNEEFIEPTLLHFRANEMEYRLLTHYYAMIHFTDSSINNYFRRFVRDFLHYHDKIYCAAGKIVKAVQYEGLQRGFKLDENGGGGFSAMHIRRGDFQFQNVKLPAEEWYNNTKEIWQPKEIIYIATDERNKSWFNPIAEHADIRFLDDYWEFAGLGDLDPNYMGMIDTIVSSRARAFAGTWFSTFSGYINRMRGYHGMTMKDSWYSFLEKKTAVHKWDNISQALYAFEWPTGWVGIDADVEASKDVF